jgi:tRNA(His) 5'-end guanylyltransferase
MQNAVFGYTQSDEISILLRDWPDLNTQQWFGGVVQKIVSVSASAAAAYFNRYIRTNHQTIYMVELPRDAVAMFDSRVFQLPKEEVVNYFLWRQQDASRNSVQMLGRHYFSHSELMGASCSQIQDKLMKEHQVNWNDLRGWEKRGSMCYKEEQGSYTIEHNPPIFTQDHGLIEQHVVMGYEDIEKV